ncbi:hypothetical protein [Alteromonas sp. OM2203]|uniref:hypothetical protein n=1 Tax=Alteromonas sp. OM2203 TaxID=3398817 RepID=UPI003AF3584C
MKAEYAKLIVLLQTCRTKDKATSAKILDKPPNSQNNKLKNWRHLTAYSSPNRHANPHHFGALLFFSSYNSKP